jgi:hypothetical protein
VTVATYEAVVRKPLASAGVVSRGTRAFNTANAAACELMPIVKVSWTEPLPVWSEVGGGPMGNTTVPRGASAPAATTERNATRTAGVKSAVLAATATANMTVPTTDGGKGGGEGEGGGGDGEGGGGEGGSGEGEGGGGEGDGGDGGGGGRCGMMDGILGG